MCPVFEHFSEQARSVIVHAQEDARELGHGYIGTEHLLLGMLREEGVALDALTSLGVSWDAAREQVLQVAGPGPGMRSGQVPFTPHAKRVLERSRRSVQEFGHALIGTGDLLFAIADENAGTAIVALNRCQVEAEQIRDAITRQSAGPSSAPGATS